MRLRSDRRLRRHLVRHGSVSSGNRRTTRTDSDGMVLLGLVVAMVILSALTLTMLVQTTTSGLGRVEEAGAAQAYYLAESGYRYAARRIAGNADMYTELHNQEISLASQGNAFEMQVFPYYFVAPNEIAGATTTTPGTSTLATVVPGGFHDDLSAPPADGKLWIGNQSVVYNSVTTTNPNRVDFNVPTVVPFVQADEIILPVGTSIPIQQTISAGNTLFFDNGTTALFPPRNGVIRIFGNYYLYRQKRIRAGVQDQLTDIQAVAGAPLPLVVPAGTDIPTHPHLTIRSIGTHGEAQRRVDFHKPFIIPETGEVKEFRDNFGDGALPNWIQDSITSDSLFGRHAAAGNRLRVTDSDSVSGGIKTALIALDWQTTPIDLAKSRSFTGGFLNYDTQISIDFDAAPSDPVEAGFTPSGSDIPTYVGAGISFRLRQDGTGFGISLLRGNNNTISPFDRMDNRLIPGPAPEPEMADRMMAILWELYSESGNFNWRWLAYNDLSRYSIDYAMDPGEGWTAPTGGGTLWATTGILPGGRIGNAWHYGNNSPANYGPNTGSSGALVSPPIPLCKADTAVLTFDSYLDIDTSPADTITLEIFESSTGVWGTPIALSLTQSSPASWVTENIDLAAYIGQTIQFRFTLTADAVGNTGRGWYVDNVKVSGDYYFPRENVISTLAIRVREAAILDFTQSPTAGTDAISPGMLVVGRNSNATGIVSEPPMITAGGWATSNTVGRLELQSVNGTFDAAGEDIWVVGTSTRLTSTAYSAKANLIRAYIGDNAGCGTANAEPFDNTRAALTNLSGGNLQWPADPTGTWSAGDDVYTQISWDVITADAATGISRISTIDEPNGIIKATSNTTSAGFNATSNPEIGLHGLGDGVLNIRYADFGLQAVVPTSEVNVAAVQEE